MNSSGKSDIVPLHKLHLQQHFYCHCKKKKNYSGNLRYITQETNLSKILRLRYSSEFRDKFTLDSES